MKRKLSISLLTLLIVVLSLASCIINPTCQHRDADDDGACDACGEEYIDGKDVIDDTVLFADGRFDPAEASYESAVEAAFIKDTLWEPGLIVARHIKVTNKATEKLNFKLNFYSLKGDADFLQVIEAYRTYPVKQITERSDVDSSEKLGTLARVAGDRIPLAEFVLEAGEVYAFTLIFKMSEAAGNEYQNMKAPDFYLNLITSEIPLCQHVDEDDNSLCDGCGESFSDGDEADKCAPFLNFELKADDTYAVSIGQGIELSKIFIPSTYNGKRVTEIADNGFSGASRLEKMILADSITKIGDQAFANCRNLQSINIPDSITTIERGAFIGCYSLEEIIIPDGIADIAEATFSGCQALKKVSIGSNVVSIGNSAFFNCESLVEFTIPDSVVSIGNSAFATCYGLDRLTIGSGVESIGDNSFSYCTALTSVIIPDSVTSVGYGVFSDCLDLIIYCESEGQPSGWNSDWNLDRHPVVWGYTADAE